MTIDDVGNVFNCNPLLKADIRLYIRLSKWNSMVQGGQNYTKYSPSW